MANIILTFVPTADALVNVTPWSPVYTLFPGVQIGVGRRSLGVRGISGVVSQMAVSPPILGQAVLRSCMAAGGGGVGHNLALGALSAGLAGRRSPLLTADPALQQAECVVYHPRSPGRLLFPSEVFRGTGGQPPQLLLLPGSTEKNGV